MSRLPLIHIPNGLYSVVSKCNNGEFHFNADEKFKLYLQHLLFCKRKLGFILYDIVCMSNHVHELYRVSENVTIAKILHLVKGHFSRKFNKQFGRKDHFWRNKSFYRIVENETYAYNTMNYFHWNPVKAGLVKNPADWPYSGFRFHILGESKGLLGQLLDRLPNQTPASINMNIQKEIQKVFSSQRRRFVGTPPYRQKMKRQFGSMPAT